MFHPDPSRRPPARPIRVAHPGLAALVLCALPWSLACMAPAAPSALGKCGPKPTQEQADASVRSFCPRALPLPYQAVVQNVAIVGPEKIYTGLVRGLSCSYGWAITFQVKARDGLGGYQDFKTVTIVASPDGKIHWRPQYGPGSD
ncbi:MAG: hypothetical protein P4L36_00165 [Holophaga sp.]|nr:hypothetical protein [Holophaga sp.]